MTQTKIYLGVGHGGVDVGAIGNGFFEKNLALLIATAAKIELKNRGYDVMQSRTTDAFQSIEDKIYEAKAANCTAFFDIHLDAYNKTASGTSCYYPKNSASAKAIAASISKAISKAIGTVNRGAKIKTYNKNGTVTDYFAATHYPNNNGFLIECLFIDNAADIKKFNAEKIGFAIAAAIAAAYPLPNLTAKTQMSLNLKPLYSSASAAMPMKTVSGIYYIYDGVNINGAYAITNTVTNCGALPRTKYITGYIKI